MIDGATAKLVQLRDLLDRMVDAIITIGRAMGLIGAAGAIGGGLVWVAVLLMTSGSTPARWSSLFFALAPVPGLFLLWWRLKLLAATALRCRRRRTRRGPWAPRSRASRPICPGGPGGAWSPWHGGPARRWVPCPAWPLT